MIRLLIVASIRLYREGLAAMLGRVAILSVVGVAADPSEALSAARDLAPDVILLDMSSDDSRKTLRDLKETLPTARIVGIGLSQHEPDILACAEAGVDGYLTREGSVDELIAVVESASRGELHCSAQFAAALMRRLAAVAAASEPARSGTRLTSREREIVHLLEQNLSNKEIAVHLGIEVATVKNHVHHLLEKLGVHRRAEAVRVSHGAGSGHP
jgi:two-component system nitrate/nitrite response regulator NarL